MRYLTMFLLVYLFFFAFTGNTFSQKNDLHETLSKLTQDAAGQYVAPLISGFGADMNSAWVSSVPKPEILSIEINFRIVAMGAFFSNANKTLNSNADFRFNRSDAEVLTQNVDPAVRQSVIDQILSRDFNVGIQGPTAIGGHDKYITVDFQGATFNVNGTEVPVEAQHYKTDINGALGNLPAMPLAAPQLTVGTVFGSMIALRYLPPVKINSDLGDLKYFGIGIMHNPAVWLGIPMPLDVAVGIYTETMDVGDIFKSSATQFSLFGGKTFGPSTANVSPYVGISVETSTISVNYTQKFETPLGLESENISFDMKGDNKLKFTLGSSFKLAVVSLNVDYSFANYNTLSLGLGVDY